MMRKIWPILFIVAIITPDLLKRAQLGQYLNALKPSQSFSFEQIANFKNGIKLFDGKERVAAGTSTTATQDTSVVIATKENKVMPWHVNGNTAVAMDTVEGTGGIVITAPSEITKVHPKNSDEALGLKIVGKSYEVKYATPPAEESHAEEPKVEPNILTKLWDLKFLPRKPIKFYLSTAFFFVLGIGAIARGKKARKQMLSKSPQIFVIASLVWYCAVNLVDPLSTDMGLVCSMFVSGLGFTDYATRS